MFASVEPQWKQLTSPVPKLHRVPTHPCELSHRQACTSMTSQALCRDLVDNLINDTPNTNVRKLLARHTVVPAK